MKKGIGVFVLLLSSMFVISFVSAVCEGTSAYESPANVSCSSYYNGFYDCYNLIDSDKNTAWLSGWGDVTSPEVVTDLGVESCISGVQLHDWVGTTRGVDISVSSDGVNFVSIYENDLTPNNQKGAKIPFTETTARYVRFNFEPMSGWYRFNAMKARLSEIHVLARPEVAVSCFDSDGGVNIDVAGYTQNPSGVFNDTCIGSIEGIEYSCDLGGNVVNGLFNCTFGCSNGACDAAPAFCNDTDGGYNIEEYGYLAFNSSLSTDTCFGNLLNEISCNPDGSPKNDTIGCANGCSNGACIFPSPFCQDPDGDNPLIKGTVHTETLNYTDYCLNNFTVVENYCSGLNPGTYDWSCIENETNFCINGACV